MDITSAVDFIGLLNAGLRNGLKPAAVTEQPDFFRGLGMPLEIIAAMKSRAERFSNGQLVVALQSKNLPRSVLAGLASSPVERKEPAAEAQLADILKHPIESLGFDDRLTAILQILPRRSFTRATIGGLVRQTANQLFDYVTGCWPDEQRLSAED